MLAFLATVGIVAVPVATARPGYVAAVTELFKLADKDGKSTVTCQYCHQNARGGPPWNAFGDAVRAQFAGEAKRNINDALYLTLKADKDSDEDGYKDVLEVVAKTTPGDAASKPEKKVEELEAELKALGGVDAFKPAAK
ncbi:MAG: hypothetical protein HC933_05260 [Pleurocapsa sp. SU_196_0]|nr:hypothetical protein [Pleurocapsa sp. SU_196_0]